ASTSMTTTTLPSTSTSTLASTTTTTSSPVAPTAAQIAATMRRTTEVDDPTTYFVPTSPAVTIPDGSGGLLTADIGNRYPTADAAGQLIFFWHNGTFVGWDSKFESRYIKDLHKVVTGTLA